MDKKQEALVDRTLKQLEHPAFRESKPARQIGQVLTSAKKTGTLDTADLRRASIAFVADADVPKYFAEADEDGRNIPPNSIGMLVLLILLLLLLAAAGDDSDLAALIQDMIDRLLAGG